MRVHRRIAQIFGYDLIHIKRNHPNIESHLKILFDFLNINVVFDVGANDGQFGNMIRENGYKGYIVSFEPVPVIYKNLESNSCDDLKWLTYNYALGSKNKNMEINVTRATGFSSFLDPNKYAKKIRGKEVPVTNKKIVEIKKLDDVFSEIISCLSVEKSNIFLKMDTQGYDLEVFKGARNVIDKIVALQSEISILPLYEGMTNYINTLTEYRKEGFEITGLYPVTRDNNTMFVVEMDCVMKRV
ncbi:MAG: FkbM family methyltransferase [Desulfobulbus propionicus]|nr:MAG: FkbM family methyltransferase [Desulfobulbus propionicus]